MSLLDAAGSVLWSFNIKGRGPALDSFPVAHNAGFQPEIPPLTAGSLQGSCWLLLGASAVTRLLTGLRKT